MQPVLSATREKTHKSSRAATAERELLEIGSAAAAVAFGYMQMASAKDSSGAENLLIAAAEAAALLCDTAKLSGEHRGRRRGNEFMNMEVCGAAARREPFLPPNLPSFEFTI